MSFNNAEYVNMLVREEGMVACVPPAPGIQSPWSGSPNLGREVSFAPDENNRQTILKLDEWGPPEMWTISLGLSADGYTSNTNYDVIAEINFGSGGSTQLIECSWLCGAMLSVPMNAVSVNARYFNVSNSANQVVPPSDLKLSVQLARGTSAKNTAFILSEGAVIDPQVLGNVTDTLTSSVFKIPAFATSLLLADDTSYLGDKIDYDNSFLVFTPTADNEHPLLIDISFVLPLSKVKNTFFQIPPGAHGVQLIYKLKAAEAIYYTGIWVRFTFGLLGS